MEARVWEERNNNNGKKERSKKPTYFARGTSKAFDRGVGEKREKKGVNSNQARQAGRKKTLSAGSIPRAMNG